MEFPVKSQSNESDRLTDLLPDLRTHIISFLPTREAIKLCVLSTQWRYSCSSVPKLEFDLYERKRSGKIDSKDKEDFKNCVNKTLECHAAHIQCFRITVSVDDKHITISDLKDWITVVLQHNVADLRIWHRPDNLITFKPIALPSSLFACSALRELFLREIELTTAISSVRFPLMRKLWLGCVKFCGDDDDLGNKLFSPTNFPMLQALEIVCCDQIKSLSISIPCFSHLVLGISNLKTTKFKISIPTLEQFDYHPFPEYLNGIEFSAGTASSLRAVRLNTHITSRRYPPTTTSTNASAILFAMDKTETLHVSDHTVECLSWDQSFATITQSLSVSLIRFSIEMYTTIRHVQVIKFLTSCFPLLQTLDICFTDIKKYMVSHQDNKLELLINESTIMLRHLRQVKISGFGGRDCEVDLVRHLVSSASNLELMTVNCQKEISPQDRMDIDVKLKFLTEVSQKLKLVCR